MRKKERNKENKKDYETKNFVSVTQFKLNSDYLFGNHEEFISYLTEKIFVIVNEVVKKSNEDKSIKDKIDVKTIINFSFSPYELTVCLLSDCLYTNCWIIGNIRAIQFENKATFSSINNYTLPLIEKRLYRNSHSKQMNELKYRVNKDKFSNLFQLKFDTKSQIKTKFNYLKSSVFVYLDLMFFHNNSFKNKTETINIDEMPLEKIKFFDSLYLGRPSLEKWIRFP